MISKWFKQNGAAVLLVGAVLVYASAVRPTERCSSCLAPDFQTLPRSDVARPRVGPALVEPDASELPPPAAPDTAGATLHP